MRVAQLTSLPLLLLPVSVVTPGCVDHGYALVAQVTPLPLLLGEITPHVDPSLVAHPFLRVVCSTEKAFLLVKKYLTDKSNSQKFFLKSH